MKYAQIVQKIVHGVYEYDPLPPFAPNIVMVPLPGDSPVQAGWLYEDGEFTEPPAPEPDNLGTLVTVLAFLDRFTDEEGVTIDLSSMGATVEAATLRRYMDKVKAAQFIDLARADTITGVTSLETVGLIANGRANTILTSPVQPHELPKGMQ